MRLLLTSSGLNNKKLAEEFLDLVEKPAEEIKIIFIPIASRYPEEIVYVDKSRNELLDIGILEENILEINLKKRTPSDYLLSECDAIFVCGGNTFYLLDRLKQTKFFKKIKDLVKKQEKVYVGVSAGSIIAGPDIKIAGFGSTQDENDIGLEDLDALNFTDISVFPHFKDNVKNEVNQFRKKVKYRVIELKDGTGISIKDGEEKIL